MSFYSYLVRTISSMLCAGLLLSACMPGDVSTPVRENRPPPTAEKSTPTPTIFTPIPSATAEVAILSLTSTPSSSQALAPGAGSLIDFSSSNSRWLAGQPPAYSDSTAASTSLSTEQAASGQKSVALAFTYAPDQKAIFNLEGAFDLSKIAKVEVTLADPAGVLVSAALAFSTGQSWLWHESQPQPIAKGINTIEVDLQGSGFMTEASQWKPGAALAAPGEVHRISMVLFPRQAGTVYLQQLFALSTNTSERHPETTAVPVSCPPLVEAVPGAGLAIGLAPSAPLRQWEMVEFDLTVPFQPANPFDPAQAAIDLTFQGPDGRNLTVPAFYYQAYDSTGQVACGSPGWKARFTPDLPGSWTASASAKDSAGTVSQSTPLSFSVLPGSGKGFIKVNPRNPLYFAYGNGETYYPVGINLGWWQTDMLTDYTRWLNALQSQGANLARVWMADWSFGIEWGDTGLGDYNNRLRQAWLLDQLFRLADERGIYIELVLINHGIFSETINPEWAANPYNTRNGGMLNAPEAFATNPQARQYFQRRLRYIAARYAANTSLFAWEWWNEADWTPIHDGVMAAWTIEMTAALRQWDPYRHLASTSYASRIPVQVLALPEIDFTQVHYYGSRSPVDVTREALADMRQAVPGKPVLLAEFGFDASGENSRSYDKDATHLHIALWSAALQGYAGPAMYWWWDSYIDPLNLWGRLGSLTTFLKAVDLSTFAPAVVRTSSAAGQAVLLSNHDQALVYVKNRMYEAAVLPGMFEKKIQELHLTFNGLADGKYQVQWYDPQAGKWLPETGLLEIKQGNADLTVIPFQKDLAARIIPAP